MSARVIGLFGTHRQAIDNLLPVAEILRQRGQDVFFVDADGLFHQNTGDLIRSSGFQAVPLLSVALPKPWPTYSASRRSAILWSIRGDLRRVAAMAPCWLLCGDNAPQRAVIDLAGPAALRVVIADAIFGSAEWDWLSVLRTRRVSDIAMHAAKRARLGLLRLAVKRRVSWLIPGHSGHSGADLMILPGRFSVDLVRRSGGNIPLYLPIGLPRYSALFDVHAPPARTSGRRLRVAVFSSAFAWHGDPQLQKIQDATVAAITLALNADPATFDARVKRHPREELAFYAELESRTKSVAFAHTIPAPDLVAWADVVITFMSSVALEALCVGKPAVLAAFGFDWSRTRGTPYAHDAFPHPARIDELVAVLHGLRDESRYAVVVEQQAQLRDYLFARETPRSAARTADILEQALVSPSAALDRARALGASEL